MLPRHCVGRILSYLCGRHGHVLLAYVTYNFWFHLSLQFDFTSNVFTEDTAFGDGAGFIQFEAEVRAVGDPHCALPEEDVDLVLWRYVSVPPTWLNRYVARTSFDKRAGCLRLKDLLLNYNNDMFSPTDHKYKSGHSQWQEN